MAFTMIVSSIKKSLPTKILSSFTLTAQPYQNIGNGSDLQTRGPIPTYTLLDPVRLPWT